VLDHFSWSNSAQPFLLQCSISLENTVIPHCYSAHPLLIQCSAILATMLRHFCHSAHSFLLQCSVILVNSVILYATVLSHFPLSYSAHPFYTTTVLMHPRYYNARSFFTYIVLSHFSLQQHVRPLSHFVK
jgi:hypothetical protein